MTRSLLLALMIAATLGTAWARQPSAEQKCRAAKNLAAGKYALCRQQAEAQRAKTGGDAEALAKCSRKFASTWQAIEDKAAAAGVTCPDEPLDQAAVEAALDQCTDHVAKTLAGVRFEDRGLTVIDHLNGLEWEKKDHLDGTIVFCPGGGPSCDDPHDADNQYQCSTTYSSIPDGSVFVDFLAKLNATSAGFDLDVTGGFAGHHDWRLPTLAELRTIFDDDVPGCGDGTTPCIDPIFGPTSTSFRGYPSSTRFASEFSESVDVWTVQFAFGPSPNEPPKFYPVRAVRLAVDEPDPCGNGTIEGTERCDRDDLKGGTCADEGFLGGTLACAPDCTYDTSDCTGVRFVDNGDGTVTDHATGLQWEQKTGTLQSRQDCSVAACPDVHDVNNAYQWCLDGNHDDFCDAAGNPPDGGVFEPFLATLDTPPCFAGHCDWRLPTVNREGDPAELETIVKKTALGCGIGEVCIDPIFGPTAENAYWSATQVSATPNDACWIVDFGGGLVSNDARKPRLSYVRAVRTAD